MDGPEDGAGEGPIDIVPSPIDEESPPLGVWLGVGPEGDPIPIDCANNEKEIKLKLTTAQDLIKVTTSPF